jgi:hypothetical protein
LCFAWTRSLVGGGLCAARANAGYCGWVRVQDAARAAADIVLLTPGLSVIIDAIIGARKIFQVRPSIHPHACVCVCVCAGWRVYSLHVYAHASACGVYIGIALSVCVRCPCPRAARHYSASLSLTHTLCLSI